MSRVEEPQISPEERNSERNENRQPLMEEGRVNTGRVQKDERKKNYVAVVLSLLSVILVMGALVVPQWSRLVSLDGTVIGQYGLFVVKLVKVEDGNITSAQYQNRKCSLRHNFREFYCPIFSFRVFQPRRA